MVSPDGRVLWESCAHESLFCPRWCLKLVSFGFPPHSVDQDLTSFPVQVSKLKSKDALTRYEGLHAIQEEYPDKLGSIAPSLVDLFGETENALRSKAVWLATTVAEDAFPPATKAWKSKDAKVREACLQVFRESDSRDATPLIVEGLADADPEVRERAAWCCGGIHFAARAESLPGLAKALKDPEAMVRSAAARSIGDFGELAKDCGSALLEATKDENLDVRAEVIRALGQVGGADEVVIKYLVGCLEDKRNDQSIRAASARSLGNIGEAVSSAEPVLVACLGESIDDKEVRRSFRCAIVSALGKVAPNSNSATSKLLEVVQNQAEEPDVRSTAVTALVDMRTDGDTILQALKSERTRAKNRDWERELDRAISKLQSKK
jgi:HEAT repeat protein